MKDRKQSGSWYRRFVIAAGVLCGAVLALLAAIVLIAPKAINSGEVRSRIEAVIAKELNGTFTYDRVELALLPRPDVVLYKVTVDLPGTLSATISSVRVRALLLPLFRGQFAVSSIALEKPEFTLIFPDDAAGRRPRKTPKKQPESRSFDTALAVASRELPDLSIKLSRGKISLQREGRAFLSLGSLDASLAFVSDERPDQAAGSAAENYHITGKARATVSGTTALPAPLTISVGWFDATPGKLVVKSSQARIQDLDASISGSFKDYLTGSSRSDIKAGGTIGPDALAWLQKLAGLPEGMSIRAPLAVNEARLISAGTGSDASQTLTVKTGTKVDTTISLTLRREPGLFSIDSLHVKDSDSNGKITFSSGTGGIDLSFGGNLTGTTVDRVLELGRLSTAWLKGDLRAHVPHGTWREATVYGSLEGGQFSIPLSHEIPVTLDRFTFHADGSAINLGPVVLSLGQDVLQVNGSVTRSESGVVLNLDAATDRIDFLTLRRLMEQKPKEKAAVPGTAAGRTPKVSGSIRIRAAAFVVDRYKADALDLRVTFGKEQITAALDHASVCGISLTGSLRIAENDVEVGLTTQATGKKLEDSLPCILQQNSNISGTYDLTGQFDSRGTWDTLLSSTGGSFFLTAAGGRIQSGNVVKGVIAYLNSTSLLKGSHDKLLKEGVPYENITFRGTLGDGIISLSEAVIKSRDLNIAAEGNIDLRDSTLALNVLAAPFTKLDRLLGSVPLVKSIVGNALIAVPARVEGTFQHPSVKPLPVLDVGKNVTNLLKNTLQAPMKIIDPTLPKELDRKNAPPQE